MANPGTLHDWVEDLPARGRYTFSRVEALSATDASPAAVKQTLYRLKKRKAIVSPRRDFFVVLPPEYRTVGCPPASWFIDQLMEHLGRRYYVALLTAGAFHGAAHQAPMVFQVIADAPERNITVGGIRINFHVSNLVEGAATVRRNTPTGTIASRTCGSATPPRSCASFGLLSGKASGSSAGDKRQSPDREVGGRSG